MPLTDGRPASGQWLRINEIARWYGESASSVRLKLKTALKEKVGEVPKNNVDSAYQVGSGRIGHRYHVDFVEKVFGSRPDEDLTEAERSIINNPARVANVRVVGSEADDLLTVLLTSRLGANDAYDRLLIEMITSGRGLRIRCITGTDFFNAHRPTAEAFFQRSKNGLDGTRVLLVYPFGHGAKVRSAGEGDPELDKSQFARDAASTFGFIRANADRLQLEPKWIEDLPPGLLLWTEKYALVEPYDCGRQYIDRSGCIGRKAPIMVVRGGTAYHTILKNGFDYVFDGKEKETYLKTFSLEDLTAAYDKTKVASIAIPRPSRRAK